MPVRLLGKNPLDPPPKAFVLGCGPGLMDAIFVWALLPKSGEHTLLWLPIFSEAIFLFLIVYILRVRASGRASALAPNMLALSLGSGLGWMVAIVAILAH